MGQDTIACHPGTLTFVELGTRVFSGSPIHKNDDFAIEQSLKCLQGSVATDNTRIVSAYICNSMLTSLLAEVLTNSSQAIWMGCISPTLIDIDETARTMALLTKFRHLSGIPVSFKIHKAHFSSDLNFPFERRLKLTKDRSLAKIDWLAASGMEICKLGDILQTPHLLNLSHDVYC